MALHEPTSTEFPRQGISLSTYLTRFILLGMLPLVLIGAWLASLEVRDIQDEHRQQAAQLLRASLRALDFPLSERIHGLELLAGSPLLEERANWPGFYQEAQGFREAYGSHVILADLNRHMLLNTRSPLGEPLPMLPNLKGRSAFSIAMQTGNPAVSDSFLGPVAKTQMVSVAVPVLRHGKPVLGLLTTVEVEQFQNHLDHLHLPNGWVVRVTDGTGEPMARRTPPGFHSERDVDAQGRFTSRSQLSGWAVTVEIPRQVWRAPIMKETANLGAILVVAALAGLLVGTRSSRHIAQAVAAIGQERELPEGFTRLREITEVRAVLDEAGARFAASEDSLREIQERLQILIDHAPASMAMFDRDMRYLAVSQRWREDFSLTGCDILGRSHYEIFPDIPDRWREIHLRGLAGEGSHADEDRFDRADGATQWLRWEVLPWHAADGSVGGIVIFSEEITKWKAAEDALKESEARFRGAVANAAIGFALTTPDGHFLDANRAYLEITGYELEELKGMGFSQLIHPEDLATNLAQLGPLMRGDQASFVVENRYIQKGGKSRWVRKSISTVRDEAGLPRWIIALVEDIEERKRAEDEIRTLNAQLEERVAERTAELTAANQELEAFSYAVSHDLRAPLRAMSGFSQAMVEDFEAHLPPEARAHLDQIVRASQRMAELIDGLLALSRCVQGELTHQPVDLSLLAGEVRQELERGQPGRRVTWHIEAGLQAKGDPRMLQSMLRNLLGNAWKYTQHQQEPEIRFGLLEEEGTRYFCISDNGAGFDMAHAVRLFQPFQRLHRQDEFQGLGIGLATVQRIIHRHGGRIQARSERGKGAAFLFTLPVQDTEEPAA